MPRFTLIVSAAAVLFLLAASSPPQDRNKAAIGQQPIEHVATDDVLIYRAELFYQGEIIDGPVDLEFRLFADELDTLQIGPTIEAAQWPVEDGLLFIGLDFGDPGLLADGAWLDVTVDGTILSPRQHIAPPGITLLAGEATFPRREATTPPPDDFERELAEEFEGGGVPTRANAAESEPGDSSKSFGPISVQSDARSGTGTVHGAQLSRAPGTQFVDFGDDGDLNDSLTGLYDGYSEIDGSGWETPSRHTVVTNRKVGIGLGRGSDGTPRANLHTSGRVRFDDLSESNWHTSVLVIDANNVLRWRTLENWDPYSAGQGLLLEGGQFRLDPQDADDGDVLTWDGDGGGWVPAALMGGDISAVRTPEGSGLTGGAESGDVELQVADVTSDMIRDDTIMASDLTIDLNSLAKVSGGFLRIELSDGVYPSVIGGYSGNYVLPGARSSTISGGGIAGGGVNRITDWYGTIGGGEGNQAGDDAGTPTDVYAPTVAGGAANKAMGYASTVGGGENNTASGSRSTVPGGESNMASGDWSIAFGRDCDATAAGAWALGDRGDANHEGSVCWAAHNLNGVDSTASRQFNLLFSGGYRLFTDSFGNTGAELPAGESMWQAMSDRNVKERVEPVDPRSVLKSVVNLPIATWQYRDSNSGIRHMGPMAQDFYSAFGLGGSDRHISTHDPAGVALAAIQGLHHIVMDQRRDISDLRSRVESLERTIALLLAERQQ